MVVVLIVAVVVVMSVVVVVMFVVVGKKAASAVSGCSGNNWVARKIIAKKTHRSERKIAPQLSPSLSTCPPPIRRVIVGFRGTVGWRGTAKTAAWAKK